MVCLQSLNLSGMDNLDMSRLIAEAMARDDDSAPFRNASLARATGNEPDGKQNVLNPTAVSNGPSASFFRQEVSPEV